MVDEIKFIRYYKNITNKILYKYEKLRRMLGL